MGDIGDSVQLHMNTSVSPPRYWPSPTSQATNENVYDINCDLTSIQNRSETHRKQLLYLYKDVSFVRTLSGYQLSHSRCKYDRFALQNYDIDHAQSNFCNQFLCMILERMTENVSKLTIYIFTQIQTNDMLHCISTDPPQIKS